MTTPKRTARPTIPALKVRQWLAEWNEVEWNPKERRGKPGLDFYLFTMSAPQLKSLCGIRRRSAETRRRGREDLGIQRRHDENRSKEISEFIRYGYPWSDLSAAKRASGEFQDLRKPGWLPTAVVVNIRTGKDKGEEVDDADLVTVSNDTTDMATITLPAGSERARWKPKAGYPIEVIDGQHRLWAFEEAKLDGAFQLPVVAFVNLDLSWRAYLFYTINIKPKRINASLAFDLYPLLRTEDWLERSEGHVVYREARAQEIVDLLYSHRESPWHRWINMLGDRGRRPRMVSQAAWVRSLLATYVKPWEGRGVRIGLGGLFGSRVGEDEQVLPWSRFQQAAFLIVVGQLLREAIEATSAPWASELRSKTPAHEAGEDAAFYGDHSLLNQDQGIRAVLHITNDLCYQTADQLGLRSWAGVVIRDGDDESQVSSMIASLRKQVRISRFLKDLSAVLASYDWRASKAPGLTTRQSSQKAAFRGSGGYGELRRDVLSHLSGTKWEYAKAAAEVLEIIG